MFCPIKVKKDQPSSTIKQVVRLSIIKLDTQGIYEVVLNVDFFFLFVMKEGSMRVGKKKSFISD